MEPLTRWALIITIAALAWKLGELCERSWGRKWPAYLALFTALVTLHTSLRLTGVIPA